MCKHRILPNLETRVVNCNNGPHKAKKICCICGQMIKWVSKTSYEYYEQKIEERKDSLNLNQWEKGFLENIKNFSTLSEKQINKINYILS